VPTHAIGEHSHHHAGPGGVGKQIDAVLLLLAVSDVPCNAGFNGKWHGVVKFDGSQS
jgi:hypothetical protein